MTERPDHPKEDRPGSMETDETRTKKPNETRQGEVVLGTKRERVLFWGIIAGALVLLLLVAVIWWA